MVYRIIPLFFAFYSAFCLSQAPGKTDGDWSWFYPKKVTADLCKIIDKQPVCLFEKKELSPFSQLIFSWNALRPTKGHFSFFGRVRYATDKKWSDWFHMHDWGYGIQRSYKKSGVHDKRSSYTHVRLDIDERSKADAFSIKVVAHDGASLSDLHALAINSCDLNRCARTTADHYHQLPSAIVPNVPTISQFALCHPHSDRICSPTSCSMVIQKVLGKPIDPHQIAGNSLDTGFDAYGSWPYNTAHLYELGFEKAWFFVRRLNSFTDLHRQLTRGIPVVVSVRGYLPGAPKPYEGGHLLVVVGWDRQKKEVICHDPAFSHDHLTKINYPADQFLAAWHLSRHLAYWVEPK